MHTCTKHTCTNKQKKYQKKKIICCHLTF